MGFMNRRGSARGRGLGTDWNGKTKTEAGIQGKGRERATLVFSIVNHSDRYPSY